MTSIARIYDTYRIPPALQNHMYQVAALGLWLADHIMSDLHIDRKLITTVNLLHDIGNIIKFDFRPGKLIEIPDTQTTYWKKVQKTFIAKYGNDEHVATERIAKELCVDSNVLFLLHQTGISKIEHAIASADWSVKIIRICDERISPQGVVTVEDRYADLLTRYQGRDHKLADADALLKRKSEVLKLEAQIQAHISRNLQNIKNITIKPYIAKLHEFQM